jgi:hypothetical protein
MAADGKLIDDFFFQAIAEFETNPLSPPTLLRLASERPGWYAAAGIGALRTATDQPVYRCLAGLLVKNPEVFQQLCDPWQLTRDQAAAIARQLMSVDSSFDVQLARQLPGRDTPDSSGTLQGATAERALDILDEVSDKRVLVPVLNHLTNHPDKKISSKATLLIGKRIQDISWAKRVIRERADPRVRANVFESIWGLNTPDMLSLFREGLEDPNNRVVGNAIVGLHLGGDPDTPGILRRFAADQKPDFRMTAAWAMGRICDPGLIGVLTPLVKDNHPGVRRAALRALKGIRQVEKNLANPPAPAQCAKGFRGFRRQPV